MNIFGELVDNGHLGCSQVVRVNSREWGHLGMLQVRTLGLNGWQDRSKETLNAKLLSSVSS